MIKIAITTIVKEVKEIERCGDCPHITDEYKLKPRCQKTRKGMLQVNVWSRGNIPDWCPFMDKIKEEKDELLER